MVGRSRSKLGKGSVVDLVYASPSCSRSLEGLPETYIEVGGLDLFRVGCVEYVARLARSGVTADFHLCSGVPHLFDSLPPEVDVARRTKTNQLAASKSFQVTSTFIV